MRGIWMLIIGAAIVIIAVVAIVALTGEPAYPGATAPAATSSPSTSTSTSPPATSQPDLILVRSWSGSGIKTTESFTIHRQPWGIVWTNTPDAVVGVLQVMIYRLEEPNIPISIAANTQERAIDTSYVYETGDFFLMINSANTQWEVTILEPSG